MVWFKSRDGAILIDSKEPAQTLIRFSALSHLSVIPGFVCRMRVVYKMILVCWSKPWHHAAVLIFWATSSGQCRDYWQKDRHQIQSPSSVLKTVTSPFINFQVWGKWCLFFTQFQFKLKHQKMFLPAEMYWFIIIGINFTAVCLWMR